jgi:hypothetical protein
MSELDEAGKSLVQLGKLLGPIIAAGPVLEKIGSLDKYLSTLEANIERAKKDETTARKKLEDTLQLGAVAEAKHHQSRQLKNAEVQKLYAEAEQSAAEIISTAQRNAEKIIADARTAAASIRADAGDAAATAAKERDQARNEKARLDAEIADKMKLRDKISATIAGWAA